jgi:hypothetical protein
VIVKNEGQKVADGDKTNVCNWPIGAGTTCTKTFTKADSLRRHRAEAHHGSYQKFLKRIFEPAHRKNSTGKVSA